MIGETVSHYRVLEKIGTGGMGVVYRAEDSRLGRQVAIKFLSSESPADVPAVERFKRELRAAAALNHPNICTIHDTGERDGHLFMVMELLEGESLERRLRGDAIPLEVCLEWAAEVAAGLAEAHARGIVHRDIKPSNLFVTKLNHVKILDFGVAKWTESEEPQERVKTPESATETLAYRTSPGAVVGTPSYMSPEQISGSEIDARADLFALGIVLYEMATGVAPFTGRTASAITAAILYQPHEPPSQWNPTIPAELERVINRLLQKNPAERYQDASELVSDLRRIQRALQAPAARQRKPRNRTWQWALVGVALLVVAAGYWVLMPAPLPRPGNITQVTNDGGEKEGLVTDGSRVFYLARGPGEDRLLQAPLGGGDPVAMPENLNGMAPLDISAARSELLLADESHSIKGEITPQDPMPLFAAPTVGGTPRRLGDLVADDACWSPSGDRIALAKGRDILIASADGTGARRLYTAGGAVDSLSWSPDGRLRFAVGGDGSKLWEIAVAGGGAHLAFPERGDYQGGGDWFGNGRYFLFTAGKERGDVWIRQERTGLSGVNRHAAQRLTSGPMECFGPKSTPDGKRIVFYGRLVKGKLARYDMASGEWLPYLSGLSAVYVDFSPDGQAMAYVGYPDGKLWRSDVDGGHRLQLAGSLFVSKARWSPDGSEIAFVGNGQDGKNRIYTVPANGGAAHQVTNAEVGPSGDIDPNWFPDGKSLLFSSEPTPGTDSQGKLKLWRVDLESGKVSALEGSENLWSPRISPDGKKIIALGFPKWKPTIYDLQTHERTEIADTTAGWPSWSRDGTYAGFIHMPGPTYSRYYLGDGRLENVVFKSWHPAPFAQGWVRLAPDGSLLTAADASVQEIFTVELGTR